MKKILFLLFIVVGSHTLFAQQIDKNFEAFLLQKFPEYLPSYVIEHATPTPVTKKDTKKKYHLFDTKTGTWTQGKLRIGDTIIVFNKKPFFATKQKVLIGIEVGKEKNKTSRIAQKTSRQRRPLDPQVIQVGAQIGQQVLTGIIWRTQTSRRW